MLYSLELPTMKTRERFPLKIEGTQKVEHISFEFLFTKTAIKIQFLLKTR